MESRLTINAPTIRTLPAADELTPEVPKAGATVNAEDCKAEQPVGKPTHIDALSGVYTFKDGSRWAMDLDGNLQRL
jgi:hypothetical protein